MTELALVRHRLYKRKDSRGIVIGRETIYSTRIATLTHVHKHVIGRAPLKRERFHQTPTLFSTITRLYVDVLTPQAFRAVIRVSRTDDESTAVRAREILYCFLKRHSRYCTATPEIC